MLYTKTDIIRKSILSSYLTFNQARKHIEKNINSYRYSSKKPQNLKNKKKQNLLFQKKQNPNQILWKLNIFLNVSALGVISVSSLPAANFALIFNSIFQIYQSGMGLDKFAKLADTSSKWLKLSEFEQVTQQTKIIFSKILINKIFLFLSTVIMGLVTIYPSFIDINLIMMNFWILFNIKTGLVPHGYYLSLLSFLVFQYFYFKKKFLTAQEEKNKSNQIV